MDFPTFEIFIDLNEPNTKVTYNSLVDSPAHEDTYQLFSKDEIHYEFNDELQMVVGVAIMADKKLIRQSEKFGTHYVVFRKKAIRDIAFQMSRDGKLNALSVDHNSKKIADSAILTMIYQVDEERGLTAPKSFEYVTDGSLIMGYKLSKEDYDKAKERKGFSIEGDFFQELIVENEEEEFLKAFESFLNKIK